MSERRRDLHRRRLLGQSRPGRLGRASCASTAREKELSGGEAATTNNRMELMAAIEALEGAEAALRGRPLHRQQYVRDGITAWIDGWKRNGWKTADKKPVKNAELWQALDAARAAPRGDLALGQRPRRRSVNERADALARAAMAPFRKRRGGAKPG